MKLGLLSLAAALCLSVALSAQVEELKPEPEFVRRMLQEGWIKVAEGVLQRTESGPVETVTYGEDGLRWTEQKLEARIELLEKEYASHPSGKLAGILRSLERQLMETQETLASGAGGAEAVSSNELASCDFDAPQPAAAADPETGSSAPGVKANATATFQTTCGDIGNAYAYAYARAATSVNDQRPPVENEDPPYGSPWPATATASASMSGHLDCFSDAFARAWSDQLGIDRWTEDTNYSCPPATPPFTASISGPLDVRLDKKTYCQTVTWNASATGGSGVVSYKWYFGTGTAIVGTGSSWSRTFCRTNTLVTVRVVATDTSAPAKTDDATFTTWIHY